MLGLGFEPEKICKEQPNTQLTENYQNSESFESLSQVKAKNNLGDCKVAN